MPYIKKEDRAKWTEILDQIEDMVSQIPLEKKEGELNYFISSILYRCYEPSYFNYNREIGLLECAKLEIYRRLVASYEDKKIKSNSDVFLSNKICSECSLPENVCACKNMIKFCECGSPLCGHCGKCIMEHHPKESDGGVSKFGADCPFAKKE